MEKAKKRILFDEIKKILSDALFQEIHTVILRELELQDPKGFAEISQCLIEGLPKLKKVIYSINADGMAWDKITDLHERVAERKKELHVDISVDCAQESVYSVDDAKVNVNSATNLVERARELNLPLIVNCMLTPSNCYFADDLLIWLEEKKIQDYYFWLGNNIDRFSSSWNVSDHHFTESQIFHLVCFFDKLAAMTANQPETNFLYRNTVRELSFGKPNIVSRAEETLGCIVLGSNSKVKYFSIGKSELNTKPNSYSSKTRVEDQDLLNNIPLSSAVCQYCTIEELPAMEKIIQGKAMILSPWEYRWKNLNKKFAYPRSVKPYEKVLKRKPEEWKNVLITGWYGTETAGDKAILGELLHTIKSYNPEIKVTITTIDEKISRQTNKELSAGAIEVIDIKHACNPVILNKMDAVIIGGGPLMEVEQIEDLWRIFQQANEHKIARIIFGCGIGPIYTKRVEKFVSGICQLATSGFFRDKPSFQYALKLGANSDIKCACDPALSFVVRWRKQMKVGEKHGGIRIAGLVREQTKEYLTDVNLEEKNDLFARQLSETFQDITKVFPNVIVELLPMHMYWKGNDDRIFNRKILNYSRQTPSVFMEREYLDIYSLLNILHQNDIAIAMRYHGHLFSMALGIPFLSVNYSGKQGKVSNLIREIGYQRFAEDYSLFSAPTAARKIENIVKEKDEIANGLLEKTERLVNKLNEMYGDLFG
jgi:polysaccharide pyruvyl transferase WcaK-like protein